MSNLVNPFGLWAAEYRSKGMWPRPIRYPGIDPITNKPYGKMCKEPGWNTPDISLPPGTLERWDNDLGHYNIGLLMGTPLPDGTFLGAVDIDHDDYVSLGRAILRNPMSGRFGSKGAVFFVRYTRPGLKTKFRVKGDMSEKYGQVVELLFEGTICVIPPSIHPDTGESYRWIGTPLHEMDLSQLPLIGE